MSKNEVANSKITGLEADNDALSKEVHVFKEEIKIMETKLSDQNEILVSQELMLSSIKYISDLKE